MRTRSFSRHAALIVTGAVALQTTGCDPTTTILSLASSLLPIALQLVTGFILPVA